MTHPNESPHLNPRHPGPPVPSGPPRFGRSPVTGPVAHDAPTEYGPAGHGPGGYPGGGRGAVHGEIVSRPPTPGGRRPVVPAPAYAHPDPRFGGPGIHGVPGGTGGHGPFAAPPALPAPDPTDVARRRSAAATKWAVATAILFALGATATWASYQSPGGSPLLSMLMGPLSTIVYFMAVVSSGVLGAYAISTLRALRDRARSWDPPLSRSDRQITAMHLWPGRNITGPVVALAETGIGGPGKYAWFATCVLWPLSMASVLWSNGAIGVMQTGVLATIAAIATAATASALRRGLAPPDPRRMVPGGAAAPAFWSDGLIRDTGARTPETIVPPIDDSVTSLYITSSQEEKP